MDKEFLTDYAAKQLEQDTRFAKLLEEKKFEEAKQLSDARIGGLEKPVGRAAQFASLWPQVPFFGTIIVPLSPFSEPHFTTYHGFHSSEIGEIVNFAKQTHRVKFVLNDPADEFAGLDFLDPIFKEMRPTMDNVYPPQELTHRMKEYMDCYSEFDALARINFYRYMETISRQMRPLLGPGADQSTSWASNLMHTYAFLGSMGYVDMKQTIGDCLIESPRVAHTMLLSLEHLLVSPVTDPYGAIHNVTSEDVARWKSATAEAALGHGLPRNYYERVAEERKDVQFPSEIGRFLIRKLHNYPDTLDGCRYVCGLYDQHELRRIVISLQQAISKKDFSAISSESDQLSKALDEAWSDSKQLERNRNAIRGGMTFGLGLVGTLAALPFNPALGGLLFGLGFQVLDQVIQLKTDSISDRLSKAVTPDFLINIYEFKRDHSSKIAPR
jgi:hypothetical protein